MVKLTMAIHTAAGSPDTYYSGDTVSGVLTVTVDKPVQTRSLHVQIIGVEKAEVRRSANKNRGRKINYSTYLRHYTRATSPVQGNPHTNGGFFVFFLALKYGCVLGFGNYVYPSKKSSSGV